jgi:hypothetical protein
MENLRAGDLAIDLVQPMTTEPLRVVWSGKSSDRNPGAILDPFFQQLLATAETRHVPVQLRFEKLLHFNSSTIASLIQLIQDARQRKVALTVVFDRKLRWQQLSFDALRVFVGSDGLFTLRSVEEVP